MSRHISLISVFPALQGLVRCGQMRREYILGLGGSASYLQYGKLERGRTEHHKQELGSSVPFITQFVLMISIESELMKNFDSTYTSF